MTITELLLFGLATWRISSMLVGEEGPWHIFRRVRELTGIAHDNDGFPYAVPENFFAGMLSCVWCTSMWVALFWVALWLISPQISAILSAPFALSSVAVLVNQLVGKD